MKKQQTTQYVILGVLMTEPKHGYEIDKFLSIQLGNIWHVSTSQLYLLLQRLEVQGMVDSLVSSPGNRPPRKTISITAEGRSCFLSWVQSPTQHLRDLRIEFLTKLFFFRHLSLKNGDLLIRSQIQLLEDLREKVKTRRMKQHDTFRQLVLGFKLSQFEVCLNWVQTEARPFIEKIG